jgi:hypothetical protein
MDPRMDTPKVISDDSRTASALGAVPLRLSNARRAHELCRVGGFRVLMEESQCGQCSVPVAYVAGGYEADYIVRAVNGHSDLLAACNAARAHVASSGLYDREIVVAMIDAAIAKAEGR